MSRKVYAFLRMSSVGGSYPFPTSEEDYNTNIDLIDVVIPSHGGVLNISGDWIQNNVELARPWSLSLPNVARSHNQLYIPSVSNDTDIETILDSTILQETAADNLVALATTRFDAPWDGVLFDFINISYAYRDKLSDFYILLSNKLHAAGLLFIPCMRGIANHSSEVLEEYAHDLSILDDISDFIMYYVYTFWQPVGGVILYRSPAPYWWINDCIQYALHKGISEEKLIIGFGSYSLYLTDSTDWNTSNEITYNQAIQIAQDEGADINLIELVNNLGVYKEKFATIDSGHLWIHDSETLEYSLDLLDRYSISGIADFILGAGDSSRWQIVENWKNSEIEVNMANIDLSLESQNIKLGLKDNGDGTYSLTTSAGSSEDVLGLVGGMLVMQSKEFARPNDATPYSANDVVSNSTVTTTLLEFDEAGRAAGFDGYITGARISTNKKSITPRFRVHLFDNSNPNMAADNAQFKEVYADVLHRVAYFDLPNMVTAADTANSDASRAWDFTLRVPYVTAAGETSIYAALETLDIFTPASGQLFTLSLYFDQN